MKKAQGISMNVIIIAAIALLVLVVLSVVYIGKMGSWGKTTNSCISNGGKCSQQSAVCGEKALDKATSQPLTDYNVHYPIWDCENDWEDGGQKYKFCCIKIKP